MKKEKMTLSSIKSKLSRTEMKTLMAGSGYDLKICTTDADCSSGYVCRTRATDGVKRCVKGTIG